MNVRWSLLLVLSMSSVACRQSKSANDGGDDAAISDAADGSTLDAGDGSTLDAGPTCYEFASAYVGAVAALADGRNSCTVDADCFSVTDTAVACGDIHIGACPVSVAVGNEADVQADVDALRAEACDGHFTMACTEGPTCGFVAACVYGTCNLL